MTHAASVSPRVAKFGSGLVKGNEVADLASVSCRTSTSYLIVASMFVYNDMSSAGQNPPLVIHSLPLPFVESIPVVLSYAWLIILSFHL